MVDRNGQTFDRGGGHADPFSNFLGSMFGAVISQMENIAKSFELLLPWNIDACSTPKTDSVEVAQLTDMSPVLAQACMATAISSLRYWSALAELVVQYEASLVKAASEHTTGQSAVSPAECRVLADELRAFLRGIGDAATREARRLQYELEQISEAIAQTTDQATLSPYPYEQQRRHEMKL
ncbi:MAG: hypothetical protein KME35_05915 [Aphanocapsa sp. GSE-SYN-MK-11-07L]|jgi:hypothetical protein|nr:hypothetical protein [Aphanocapsa sp. GSE-SYN-MK-11-07L]